MPNVIVCIFAIQNSITSARNNIFPFRKKFLVASILFNILKKRKSTSDPPMGVSRGRRYRRAPPPFWTKRILWNINYNWVFFQLTTISKLGEFALSVLISYWFNALISTKISGGCAPDPLMLPSLAVRRIWLEASASRPLFASSWIRPCPRPSLTY